MELRADPEARDRRALAGDPVLQEEIEFKTRALRVLAAWIARSPPHFRSALMSIYPRQVAMREVLSDDEKEVARALDVLVNFELTGDRGTAEEIDRLFQILE